MSTPQEQLKSMLQDLINDKTEQADVTLHNYIVAKTQAVAGFSDPVEDAVDDTVPAE